MKQLNEVNIQLENYMFEVFEKDKASTTSEHVKNVLTTAEYDNDDPSSTTDLYAYHESALSKKT